MAGFLRRHVRPICIDNVYLEQMMSDGSWEPIPPLSLPKNRPWILGQAWAMKSDILKERAIARFYVAILYAFHKKGR